MLCDCNIHYECVSDHLSHLLNVRQIQNTNNNYLWLQLSMSFSVALSKNGVGKDDIDLWAGSQLLHFVGFAFRCIQVYVS